MLWPIATARKSSKFFIQEAGPYRDIGKAMVRPKDPAVQRVQRDFEPVGFWCSFIFEIRKFLLYPGPQKGRSTCPWQRVQMTSVFGFFFGVATRSTSAF